MIITILRTLTTALALLISTHSFSQSGTVYYFVFKVDPVLTEYEKINYDRALFSGFSEGDAMPEELMDSIKLKTNQALSELLSMPVSLCYQQKKSGENIDSDIMHGYLPGLPGAFPFKHGKARCPENSRYIKLYVQLFSGVSSSVSTEPAKTKTKIKPRLEITAKIFDENNTEITKYHVVVKNFEKLRSETRYYSGYQITKTEALSPVDIYAMYQSGLEELLKE